MSSSTFCRVAGWAVPVLVQLYTRRRQLLGRGPLLRALPAIQNPRIGSPATARRVIVSSMPEDWAKVNMAKSTRSRALIICFMISISGRCRGANNGFTRTVTWEAKRKRGRSCTTTTGARTNHGFLQCRSVMKVVARIAWAVQ